MAEFWDGVYADLGIVGAAAPVAPATQPASFWDKVYSDIGIQPQFDLSRVEPRVFKDEVPVSPEQYDSRTPQTVRKSVQQQWESATPDKIRQSRLAESSGIDTLSSAWQTNDGRKVKLTPAEMLQAADRALPELEAIRSQVAAGQFQGDMTQQPQLVRDFMFRSLASGEFLPQGVQNTPFAAEAGDLSNVGMAVEAMRKIEKNAASPTDYVELARFLKIASDDEKRTFAGRVRDTLVRLPAFAVALGMAGGSMAAGRKIAEEGVEKLATRGASELGEQAIKNVAGRGIQKAAGLVGGAMAAAAHPAMQPLVVTEALRQTIDEIDRGVDENGNPTLRIATRDPGEAYARGYGQMTKEVLTEGAGELMGPAVNAVGDVAKSAVSKLGMNRLADAATARLAKLYPSQSLRDISSEIAKAAKFNGVPAEVLEERLGELLGGATGLDEDYGTLGDLVSGDGKRFQQGLTQLAAEVAAFGVLPAANVAAQQTFGRAIQRDEAIGFYASPQSADAWAQSNPQAAASLVQRGRHSAAAFADADATLPPLTGQPGDSKLRRQWLSWVEKSLSQKEQSNDGTNATTNAEATSDGPTGTGGTGRLRGVPGDQAQATSPAGQTQETGQATGEAGQVPEVRNDESGEKWPFFPSSKMNLDENGHFSPDLTIMTPAEVEAVWRMAYPEQTIAPGRSEMIRQIQEKIDDVAKSTKLQPNAGGNQPPVQPGNVQSDARPDQTPVPTPTSPVPPAGQMSEANPPVSPQTESRPPKTPRPAPAPTAPKRLGQQPVELTDEQVGATLLPRIVEPLIADQDIANAVSNSDEQNAKVTIQKKLQQQFGNDIVEAVTNNDAHAIAAHKAAANNLDNWIRHWTDYVYDQAKSSSSTTSENSNAPGAESAPDAAQQPPSIDDLNSGKALRDRLLRKIDEWVENATRGGTRPLDTQWERGAVKRLVATEFQPLTAPGLGGSMAAAKIAVAKATTFEQLKAAVSKINIASQTPPTAPSEPTSEQAQQPKTIYRVGEKTWFRGDEVTITSEPYELSGGEFQDAVRDDGKKVSVVTPRYEQARINKNRLDWQQQQDDFKKLPTPTAGGQTGSTRVEPTAPAGPAVDKPKLGPSSNKPDEPTIPQQTTGTGARPQAVSGVPAEASGTSGPAVESNAPLTSDSPELNDLIDQLWDEDQGQATAAPQAEKKPKSIRQKKDAATTPPTTEAKPKTKIQSKAAAASEKGKASRQEFLDAIRKKMGGSSPTAGLDLDLARLAIKAAKDSIAEGMWNFAEFVESMYVAAPDLIDTITPYLEVAWKKAHSLDTTGKVSPSGKVADVLKARAASQPRIDYGTVSNPNRVALGRHFGERLANGAKYERIDDARKEAGELLGGKVEAGTQAAKDVDEAVEQGVVIAARKIVADGQDTNAIYDRLVDLYGRQPNLAVRTSTSMAQQAYSTPAPLAYLASSLADVQPGQKVYDSAAGNGMLLLAADTENAFANELNSERAEALKSLGISTSNKDATTYRPLARMDTVIINPPFGTVPNEQTKQNTVWTIDGVETDKVDHAIVLNTLQSLKNDGKAVLIIGSKGKSSDPDMQRAGAYSSSKAFFDALYDNYNVTDHFTVSGDLYKRQGAGFPVDVIVIDGRGKSQRARPWNFKSGGLPKTHDSWEGLKNEKLGRQPTDVESQGASVGSTGQTGRNDDNLGPMADTTGAASQSDVQPLPERKPGLGKPVGGAGGRRPVSRPEPGSATGGVAVSTGVPDDVAGNARPDAAAVPNEDQGTSVGQPSGSGLRDRPVGERGGGPGQRTSELVSDDNAFQVPYQPGSSGKSLETLLPTNHQSAVQRSLERIAEKYGNIDKFVADELGMTVEQLANGLAAEQVDAVAMAIAAHKSGQAFILGDQTGVGKGRAALAMMIYAKRQGVVPVFVTEKPTLFRDMIRDATDTGFMPDESHFKFLATNDLTGENTIDMAGVEPNPRVIRQSDAQARRLVTEAFESYLSGKGLKADGVTYDAIFTTYNQLQQVRGAATWRQLALNRIADRVFFVMDESHNAGGVEEQEGRWKSKDDTRQTRSEYIRSLLDKAEGAYFSSATYAKRPESLTLYAKAGIGKAVSDIKQLGSLIKHGGVRLQQIISQMLVDGGNYLRRERSFDGVDMKAEMLPVDLKAVDSFATVLRKVNEFSKSMQDAVDALEENVVSSGGKVGDDNATGGAGVESSNFTSIMHNIINQFLMATKANATADRAIAAWKAGEAVVIAVDETMESALQEYASANGLATGDSLDFTFRDLAKGYLDRTREVIIKQDKSDPKSWTRHYLSDEELGPTAVAVYNEAVSLMEQIDGSLPVSPIDWMRHRMSQAGMKLSEVTGRDMVIDYSNGGAVLAKRTATEIGTKGKIKTVNDFNSGALDAVILNRSGATGLSLHASDKFKNQKRRHMLIAQPAKNIDEFMQMLGRVHRTGQTSAPKFTLIMTNAPADKRPASILTKKLSSLNANVTAAADGQVGFSAPDIMNEVGDRVIWEYLNDHPALASEMDLRLGDEPNPKLAAKATGRVSLLPVEQQQKFWDDIEQLYNGLIAELDARDENPLKAKVLDLQAKLIGRTPLFEGRESANPFEQPASLDQYETKISVRPFTGKELSAQITDSLGINGIEDVDNAQRKWIKSQVDESRAATRAYLEKREGELKTDDAIQNVRDAAAKSLGLLHDTMRSYPPGTPVSVTINNVPVVGVVTRFIRNGKSMNPAAGSAWLLDVAVADTMRRLPIQLSRLNKDITVTPSGEDLASTLDTFDTTSAVGTERRYIATGNVLAAMDKLQGVSGARVTFFTNDQGQTERGLLLPKSFDPTSWKLDQPVVFSDMRQALKFLASGYNLSTSDNAVDLLYVGGSLIVRAPKSKSQGGKYTLNKAIIRAAGTDFVSVGGRMELRVADAARQAETLLAISDVTAIQAIRDKEVARTYVGEPTAVQSVQKKADEANAAPRGQTFGFAGAAEPRRERGPDVIGSVKPDETDFSDPLVESRASATIAPKTMAEIATSLRDQVMEYADAVAGAFRPNFYLPQTAEFATANEVLRLLQNVKVNANEYAKRIVGAIVDPLAGPKQYRVFRRYHLLLNQLHNLDKGLGLSYGIEKQPDPRAFLESEIERFRKMIEDTPAIKEATNSREKIIKELVPQLVEEGILGEEVLDDPERYLHQYVELHRNAKKAGAKQKSLAEKKFSFQRKRMDKAREAELDPIEDYITSELEFLTESYTALEMKKLRDRIEQTYDRMKEFRRSAFDQNYVTIAGGQANVDRINELRELIRENDGQDSDERLQRKIWIEELTQLDPLYGFRINMAKARAKLEQTHPDLFRKVDEDTLDGFEPNADQGDADFWLNLQTIAKDETADGHVAARWFMKELAARNERIKQLAGDAFVTYQDLVNRDPKLRVAAFTSENVLFPAYTLPEHIIHKIQEEGMQSVNIHPDDLKFVLAMGGRKNLMVLPIELADQLESMVRTTPHPLAKVVGFVPKTLTRMFKWNVLKAPWRFLSWQKNNLIGNLELAIAVPSIRRKANEAFQLLRDQWKGQKLLPPQLQQAHDLAVLSSGQYVQERLDVQRLDEYKRLFNELTTFDKWNVPGQMWGWYNRVTDEAAEFHENVFRLAAFLDFKERLENGTLDYYAGSKKSVIDALAREMGTEYAAARLARELFGDYLDSSPVVQAASTYGLYPFSRFDEVVAKRTPRMIVNAFKTGDKKKAAKLGAIGAARLSLATARKLSLVFGVYAASQVINQLFHPDDEEELNETDKANPHLIVGKHPDGSTKIMRNISQMAQYFEWFGLNRFPMDFRKWMSGRKTASELVEDMAMSSVNKLASGAGPTLKTPYEVLAGKQVYPDVRRQISKPTDEILASSYGVTDEYRFLRGKLLGDGSTLRDHYWYKWIGIGTSDPNQVALSEVHSLRSQFLKSIGQEASNEYTASAKWKTLKQAAENEDYEAFKTARRYVIDKYGHGDPVKTFDSFKAMIGKIDPLENRLSLENEKRFFAEFVRQEDMPKIDRARQYARDQEMLLYQWWRAAAIEDDEPQQTRKLRAKIADESARDKQIIKRSLNSTKPENRDKLRSDKEAARQREMMRRGQ